MLLKKLYDKLVAKVNSIDASGFVLKTKYDADKSDLEKEIPDTSGRNKKTDYNTKITEIENKIPSISGLATNSALATVEDKIPNIICLVKKNKSITQKLLKLKKNLRIIIMANILLLQSLEANCRKFCCKIKQANLVTKTDFDDKLKSLNQKLTQIKQNMYLLKMN